MRDGQVRYTLAAALRPETLSQTLDALHLPAGWLAAVIDGNGIVIGATNTPGGAVGMGYTQQPFAVLDTAIGKVSKSKAADRVKNFAVLMPIAGTTWRIGVAAPIDSVAAPYHAIRALLFAGAAILTLDRARGLDRGPRQGQAQHGTPQPRARGRAAHRQVALAREDVVPQRHEPRAAGAAQRHHRFRADDPDDRFRRRQSRRATAPMPATSACRASTCCR